MSPSRRVLWASWQYRLVYAAWATFAAAIGIQLVPVKEYLVILWPVAVGCLIVFGLSTQGFKSEVYRIWTRISSVLSMIYGASAGPLVYHYTGGSWLAVLIVVPAVLLVLITVGSNLYLRRLYKRYRD